MAKWKYSKIITVICSKCRKRQDEAKVEFLNIEEDIQGCDILTFKCPICGHIARSRRFG